MRFFLAILASVAIHVALAALAVYGLSLSGDEDRTSIALDVGSVELSFAEKERDELPIAPMPPAPPPSVAEPAPPRTASTPPPPPPLLDDDGLDAMPPDFAERPLPDALEPEVKFDILETKDIPENKEEPEKNDQVEEKEKKPEPKPEVVPQSAPAAAPRQAKVDAPPKPKKSIRPVYPDGARRRGEEGDVVVEISVDERGGVVDARVVVSSGFNDLDDAACKAAKTAKFTPARRGSRPVSSVGRLTISFKLTK